MDSREKRLAQNESLFRDVNERIEETVLPAGRDEEQQLEFFCECSNSSCNLLLPMTVSEYEAVRRDPRQFLVAPGHELPEVETVVAREPAYQVVLKRGDAADFVTARDPRGE